MSEKSERNQLTASETYQLAKWIEANATRHRRMTHAEVASDAVNYLSFRVTQNNIEASRRLTGVIFEGKRAHSQKGRDRTETIARELHRVMRELNIEPSPHLVAIATGRAMQQEPLV